MKRAKRKILRFVVRRQFLTGLKKEFKQLEIIFGSCYRNVAAAVCKHDAWSSACKHDG